MKTKRKTDAIEDPNAIEEEGNEVSVESEQDQPPFEGIAADKSEDSDADDVLPSLEGLSAILASDMNECVSELHKLGDKNGGYVTFEEINALLPQSLVDAVNTEGCLKTLDELGVQVIREEDVDNWKLAREGKGRDERELVEDPIRLYMRQTGRVELLSSREEAALFKTIETCSAQCHEIFNRFRFAPVLYARVLDRLEGQMVRFDHVVSDRFDGDRESYLAKIPEFRRMLKRARGRAAVAAVFDALTRGLSLGMPRCRASVHHADATVTSRRSEGKWPDTRSASERPE